MKRFLSIILTAALLVSVFMVGGSVVAFANGETVVALEFTEKQMTNYLGTYGWQAWSVDETTPYQCATWLNWGYTHSSYANIRKLVVGEAGTLSINYGNGVYTDAGKTLQFAILDKDKKIVYPQAGGLATISGNGAQVVDLTLTVAAGDAFYFVFMNPSTDPTPYYTSSGITLNGNRLTDETTGGYGIDITQQGAGGWYYMYADSVTQVKAKDYRDMSALNKALADAAAYDDTVLAGYTDTTVAAFKTALSAAKAITKSNTQTEIDTAAANLTAAIGALEQKVPEGEKIVALEFTEKQMEHYLGTYGWQAWSVDETTPYQCATWLNWGYAHSNYANIRKLVVGETGTLSVNYGNGVYTDAGKTLQFAILDKSKKIVYPTNANGGLATISGNGAQVVDVTLPVEAGDAFYFVFMNPSADPTPYYTSSGITLNGNRLTDETTGGYGKDITQQGASGWYYMYADSVTQVKAKDYRDMSALNRALTDAAAYDDTALTEYTDATVAAFKTALSAAKAVTKANTQTEINTAAANLKTAIGNLVKKPVPQEKIVALEFTAKEMTYDAANTRWTADSVGDCVIYPWASVSPQGSTKVAIRMFKAPEAGTLKLAWGAGIKTDNGTGKLAITDKNGKILYGPIDINATNPHVLDLEFTDVEKGQEFYFVAYDISIAGAAVYIHTAVNMNSNAYADNGNLSSAANIQGDNGFYYLYATDVSEVRESEYKNLNALREQIAKAEEIGEDVLSKCSLESVTAFRQALAKAKQLTKANTQTEIDAAETALKNAIKGLKPVSTDKNAKSVSFTEKRMTFDRTRGIWSAADDPSCIITSALNYASPITENGTVAVRKLVLSQDGKLDFKWGAGVYIDNTSGAFTGTTAEFMITDKNGNILYPQGGGAALIEEGKPLTLDFTLENLKRGDALYFITLNPSVKNLPVVYNFAVLQNGQTSLQNEGGSLYGVDGAQGAKGWYYMYATDFKVSASTGGANTGTGTGITVAPDSNTSGSIPKTGESNVFSIVCIIAVLSCAVLVLKIKKTKGGVRA